MKRFLLFVSSLLFFACTERMVNTTGNIYGTVVDANTGEPLNNCSVILNPAGVATVTGSDGTFRFTNIEGGQWSIQVSKVEYVVNSRSITVIPGEENRIDFLLYKESASKGSICGTVQDAKTGEPLSGCNVLLQPTGMSATTETNGYYVFSNLAPGEYFLSVTKSNYHSNSRNNINVNAGETSTVDMLLEEFDGTDRLPDVGFLMAEEITSSSARFTAIVLDEGSHNVTECGFVYGLSPSSATIDNGVKIRATKDSSGKFNAEVQGLQPLCRYYVAAYAINALGVSYSANMAFTTLKAEEPLSPTVIYVAMNGNDDNDGTSWANAKRTINTAINSATQGQQIWVSVGYYSEIITPNDGISVYGGFSGSEKTANERQSGSRTSINGISCDVYTQETIVDGFKMSDKLYIAANSYSVVLKDYVILRNCEISNNKYNVITVSCEKKSCIIENCSICGNTLKSRTSGAVTTTGSGVVTLVNCFLQGNDQGPAIYNAGYIKTINCVIANNYEGVRSWGSGADFINTTFAGNRNFALAVNNDVQLYNCIVWDDQILNYEGNSISITLESCVHEPDGDNSAIRFVSPVAYGDDWTKADWSLSSGSSCIDSGVNIFYAIDEDPYDIAGNPRISNGTIDIGAYEYQR